MHSPFIYEPPMAILKETLRGNERVVIKGATGWVGRTATLMLDLLGVPTLLFASRDRIEKIGFKNFHFLTWDLDKAINFNPTHIIDAGYLTREFTASMDSNLYIAQNKKITDETISLIEKVEGIKLITFSSGVTQISEEQGKPYTLNKIRDEKLFEEFALNANRKITNFRIWSISGGLVTKQRGFAFSEFILQALDGKVSVKTDTNVYRRFCLVEEIIALGFTDTSENYRLIDTGGELVEIHELASKIRDLVNPNAELFFQEINLSKKTDNYYSDNFDWKKISDSANYNPSSIDSQIVLVKKSLMLRNLLNEK